MSWQRAVHIADATRYIYARQVTRENYGNFRGARLSVSVNGEMIQVRRGDWITTEPQTGRQDVTDDQRLHDEWTLESELPPRLLRLVQGYPTYDEWRKYYPEGRA